MTVEGGAPSTITEATHPAGAVERESIDRRGFSEAQRANLTRLIKGSRFSVAGSGSGPATTSTGR